MDKKTQKKEQKCQKTDETPQKICAEQGTLPDEEELERRKALKKLKRLGRAEEKKLMELLGDLPERQREILSPVVQNTAWMKVQLDRARELIATGEIVMNYDNGGGQEGIRENPAFKGYEALWKAYMQGASKILDAAAGKATQEEKEKLRQPSVLELVKERRKQA